MAKTKLAEVKVGLMVILGLAFLVMLSISIGNFETLWADRIPIFVTVPSSVGLERYAQVTYSGVRIGTVLDITYDETRDRAVIHAEIDRDSPVATDSQARFTSSSLLSSLFLEISGGSEDQKIKKLLQEGELDLQNPIYIDAMPYISIGEVFALAADVKLALQKVETLADDLRPALQKAAGFVDSVSLEFTVILSEINSAIVSTKPRISTLLDHSDDVILGVSSEIVPTIATIRKGADSLSQTLPQVVQNIDRNVDDILMDAHGLIASASPELISTMQALRESIISLKDRVENVESRVVTILDTTNSVVEDNRDELHRILLRLERTTAHLDDLSGQLAKNPWRLIWKSEGKKDPDRLSPDWDPFAHETEN
jgi:ABC-type transporter Mla subunit MlaD